MYQTFENHECDAVYITGQISDYSEKTGITRTTYTIYNSKLSKRLKHYIEVNSEGHMIKGWWLGPWPNYNPPPDNSLYKRLVDLFLGYKPI